MPRSWPRRFTYFLVCIIVRLISTVLLGLRVHGNMNWPKTGGALICANHQSYLDPLLMGVACPRRMNYLARDTLFRGAFGRLIDWFDAIPLQREGLGIGGLKASLRRLKLGELLLLFPEGTRTSDGQLQPLQPGFIALARRGQVPIIPLAIEGSYQIWPRHRRWPRRHKVCIVVGPIITVPQIQQWDDATLINELSCRIRACWDEARRKIREASPFVPSRATY